MEITEGEGGRGKSLLPIETLGGQIKAHIAAGDKATDKAEQHYKAAGIHLSEAKDIVARTKGLTWPAFLLRHCEIQRRRADELISIAEGRTSLVEVRERNRATQASFRERRDLALRNAKSVDSRLSSFSGDNEWYTPTEYVEMARKVLGAIDLDPASNEQAQKTIMATTFYTAKDNGLTKKWSGRVWMNPPYSNPEIQEFTQKLLSEYEIGNVTAAIVLTNNSGDTAWHHALAKASSAECVKLGRIKFESPTRESNSPAMGQSFFYFGKQPDVFATVFSVIGRIVKSYWQAANDNELAAAKKAA